MKILAVIPARGGSKGIPKKNIILLAGKPLIAWSIEAAHGSKYINRTVLSSDSDEILSIAQKYGAEVIKRPTKYSGDNICSDTVALHASGHLYKKEKYCADIVVLLQPTSPLRTTKDIDNAIKLFLKYKSEVLISVFEVENSHLKSFFIDKNHRIIGIVNNDFPFMNRQLLPKIYMPNGAIYIAKKEILEKNMKFYSEKTIAYIMDPRKSIDIDSKEDIDKVESILKKNNI